MVRSILSAKAFVVASLVGASAVHATNDWSVPCTSGECSYDLPSTDGTASGSVRIWGSKSAISDITNAAGWEIIGCDSNAIQQDIRLVCTDESVCQNLFEDGAEGKIVRLPQNCGANAFAHVARSWVPEDQSMPAELAKRLVKRDGTTPEVQALSLDTNFADIDPDRLGEVNIAIQGTNIPGVPPEIITSEPTRRRRSHPREFRRGLLDFVRKAIDSISNLNEFDLSQSTAPVPILDVNEQRNLVNQAFGCPPAFEAKVNVDVSAKANAAATIGVAATGTIVPPKFDDFAIISNFNADLDGSLTLTASATGSLDSGKITLFQAGIPGLDFPGILTIGPTFQIAAQAKANLDVNVDVQVGIRYTVNNGQLRFPPREGENGANESAFKIDDTPLKLSATPSAAANGRVEGHLIPSINLGISALGNVVQSNVFLNLDASAIMQLSLEASTNQQLEIGARSVQDAVVRRSYPGNAPVAVGWRPNRGRVNRVIARQDESNSKFGGCFDLKAALAVNAGAESNFFGLFDNNTQFSLFSREFDLLRKCFGSQANVARRETLSQLGRRQDLSGLICPAEELGGAEPIADEVVSASAFA